MALSGIVRKATAKPAEKSPWSADRPTKAGYYWLRFSDGRSCIVQVIHSEQDFNRLVVLFTHGRLDWVESVKGSWQGPLSPQ